jgi:hypothetical protein
LLRSVHCQCSATGLRPPRLFENYVFSTGSRLSERSPIIESLWQKVDAVARVISIGRDRLPSITASERDQLSSLGGQLYRNEVSRLPRLPS